MQSDNEKAQENKRPAHKIITGAAVVGGVAGLVVAGPILGIAGGIAAGALAASKGPGGNLSRAAGELAVTATERAQKANEKHHIVENSKKAAGKMVDGAKSIDEKHHVVEKSKEAAGNVVNGAKRFEEKHHVMEKATTGLTKSLNFVSNQLKPKDK